MAGKEYQMMFQIGARLQGQGAFKSAQANISALQREVMSLSKQQGDIAAYQKQQKAVDKTRERLKLLQEQYKILKEEMDKNGEASASLKMKVAEKESKINSETRALQENEAALQAQGNALQEAGIDTNNLSSASQELAEQLKNLQSEQEAADQAAQEMSSSMAEGAEAIAEMIAAAGIMKVFQAGYDALRQCTDASIEFESSMAAVKRTVGGSDAFLSQLGEDFKALSTEIPITTQDLTQIATTAGQLGIAQDKVQSFTEVMAKLATTTDLSADSAATMLAQFANITGMTDYERLGSVVAELGDATATTASKVVEMSQGMAAAASQAGMSSTDIMAISAAVGSLGIEAQAGSTSMSTLISTLYKAVETGEGLEDFASIANMTADQFKQAWGESAVSAMNAFIQGLNDTERNGKSAIVILDELGITNVRQTKAILGLASAGSLLSNTITQANNAWTQNTALTAKASVMYGTTESKLLMMQNGFNNLKIAIGDAFTPAIGSGAAAMTNMMRPVTEFIQKNPALVKAMTAAVGVFAAATVGVTGYVAVVRIATKVNAMFTASLAGALGPIVAVTAAVAVLAAGAILLADAFRDSQESMEDLDAEFDGLNTDFKKQSRIRELCAEYKQLQGELSSTADIAQDLDGINVTEITLKAILKKEGFTDEDDLKVITTFYNDIQTKAGLMVQILKLEGAEKISRDNLDTITELGSRIASGNGSLKQELSLIGADDITEDRLAKIKRLSSEVKDGTYKLLQELGFKNPDEVTTKDTALIVSMAKAVANGNGSITQLLSLTGVETVSDEGLKRIKSLSDAVSTKIGILSQTLNLSDDQDVSFADIMRISAMAAVIAEDEGTLRQTLSLIGADDISEEDIGKIAELAGNIKSGYGFIWQKLGIEGVDKIKKEDIELIDSLHKSIADKKGELEQILKINGAETVTEDSLNAIVDLGDKIDTKSGVLVQLLGVTGAEKITPEVLSKIQGLAAQIKTEDGKLTETLGLYGFEKYSDLEKACSLADKVKNADYQSNLGLTVDVTNAEQLQELMSALQEEAADIKSKTEAAKTDLVDAKANLATMEEEQKALEARLTYAGSETAKSNIQKMIEEQTAAVTAQKEKVTELESAYAANVTQYTLVQSAVDELTEKERQLTAVKAELAEATGLETAEIEKQIEAQDQLAAKKQAEIRQEIRSNISKQAKQYATAMWDATNGQKELNSVMRQTSKYQDYMTSGADGVKQAVIAARDAILAIGQEQGGIDWDSSEVKAYANEISNLWQLATGQGYDVRGRFNGLTTGNEIERVHWEYATEGYDELVISASQYQEAVNEANAVQQTFIDNLVAGVQEGGMSIEEMESLLHTALDDTYGGVDIANHAIQEVKKAIKEAEAASEEASTTTQATAAEVEAAIQPILDRMENLKKSYEEAYEAAYKSMDGQFKLFEQMGEVEASKDAEKAVNDMIAAMESQRQYMDQYTANLQTVKEMRLADGLISQLSDGSKESAQILADIVAGGADKIRELNTTFQSVQEGKDTFAQTVAEMETDFTSELAKMQTEMADTVAAMDMSSEAADAGKATVEAFAKGAENGIGAVVAAFAKISDAAQIIFKVPGHAAGTDNAERGFAMVGERGPELVWFNGGEKVLNAQETEAFRNEHTVEAEPVSAGRGGSGGGSTYHIEVKPEYTINGNMSPADLQPVFDQQNIALRTQIEEILADIESDRERSVYSR